MYWVPLLIYFLISYILTLTLTHYNSYKIKLTALTSPCTSFSPLPPRIFISNKKWNFKW